MKTLAGHIDLVKINQGRRIASLVFWDVHSKPLILHQNL